MQTPGLGAVGDKILGAVDDVAVAVADRPGLLARGVGTGLRLRQRETSEPFAGRHLGQIALTLRFRAGAENRPRPQATNGPKRSRRSRRIRPIIPRSPAHSDVIEARAAVFLGDKHAEHPEASQFGDRLRRETDASDQFRRRRWTAFHAQSAAPYRAPRVALRSVQDPSGMVRQNRACCAIGREIRLRLPPTPIRFASKTHFLCSLD